MRFAIYRTSERALKKAGAAVLKNGGIYSGFTLIEVLIVILIIGILATLAYSSLTELIFINRAKETAQTIRTFTERASMDAKRLNKSVRIRIDGNEIIADTASNSSISREVLSQGFKAEKTNPTPGGVSTCFNDSVRTESRIGISGITKEGFFAACFNGYCGGTAKKKEENSFKAYIKKPKSTNWEVL